MVPGVASALLSLARERLPCDPRFLAHLGIGPLRLTPARYAADSGHHGQPADDQRNDLERGIVLIDIRPYLG